MIVLKRRRPPEPVQSIVGTCVGVAEQLVGDLNNSNQVFTTANDYVPGRISILYNGQALHSPYDFLETGPNEITFIFIRPMSDDTLRATYEYEECGGDGEQMSGAALLPFGVSSYEISFINEIPDTNYIVHTSLTNVIDASPSQYVKIVTDKSTTGFTVEFSGEIDSANYVLEWTIFSL